MADAARTAFEAVPTEPVGLPFRTEEIPTGTEGSAISAEAAALRELAGIAPALLIS